MPPEDLPAPSTADRALRAAAVLAAAGSLAASAASAWLSETRPPGPIPWALDWGYWSSAGSGLALVLPGVLLVLRLPRLWIGWLLVLAGGSSVLAAFGAEYAKYSLVAQGGDLPLTGLALFTGGRFGPIIHIGVPALLVLFPTGRLPRGRTRFPGAASLVAMVGAVGLILMLPWAIYTEQDPPGPDLGRYDLDLLTPPFVPDALWHSYGSPVFLAVATASLLGGIAVFAGRFRGADAELRAQLRWMLLAGAFVVASMVGTMLLQIHFPYDGHDGFSVFVDGVFVMENALLAGAVLIAVTRYRLYDVDLLISWTLLYGALAAAVVGIDLAVFVGVGALVQDRVAGVLAAAVVAVLYAPLRVRLQLLVRRLLTGRAEPYDVVSALARRLEESPGPDELLEATARGVGAAFRSPYVRVELDRPDGTTVVVEEGGPRPGAVVLPFAYRDVPIGRLTLVPRPGSPLSDADQRLLADVVRQAAAAARATALTEELQRSREELVKGIAEERRRLRRDLHDGLGPALAAAGLKIQAARNLARRDTAAADRTLGEVGGDLMSVLADVRRLVHDLRPPALDQFGLVGAIEQQAARFTGGALAIGVVAEGDLGELPAAVEVALFRIAGEAMSNVARHSGAERCTVRLESEEGKVRVEVSDDGRGVPDRALVGVGLVAMRERAEELGGRCAIAPRPGGGTLVSAVIPVGGAA
ncbi:signal transduction histidine kinase [Actinocorallia herbida]|uniref:Oxygen sensor histidine kinase NreB n=1 Tax=Actinocorallia herbida TaxID=58109 RepID=A0A3N1CZ03_9ACTN|nr:sensor histidine kinase [Actinocorallia herbida]ROO86495.1 signal transduction histidine kinase [Actinocorallia herbida]